jgi:hypothetical protein
MTRASIPIRFVPILATAALVLAAAAAGCVRRTMTIRTAPEGATVYLNDTDLGQSPVTVDFTWYGDYDLAFEKDGCETTRTNWKINAPWYQIPPIDLFAETMIPFTLHDHREFEQDLTPAQPVDRDELITRARDFRDRAVFGED